MNNVSAGAVSQGDAAVPPYFPAVCGKGARAGVSCQTESSTTTFTRSCLVDQARPGKSRFFPHLSGVSHFSGMI